MCKQCNLPTSSLIVMSDAMLKDFSRYKYKVTMYTASDDIVLVDSHQPRHPESIPTFFCKSRNGSLPRANALASSTQPQTSDLTLPELYLHAEHDCAWSRFHTNFHFLMLGKHERHPSAASTAPLRGTLPHQNPSVTFRTLVPPICHLEVNSLYSPRGLSQYHYPLGILGASDMGLPG